AKLQKAAKEAFLNKMLICIRKKQTVELTVTEGWYCESELKSDLGWAKIDGAKARCTSLGASHHRNNQYDGEPEFWVIVKESGARKEESSYEEMHQKQQQAKEDPSFNLGGDKFKGLEQHSNRLADVAKTGETQTPVDNKYAQVGGSSVKKTHHGRRAHLIPPALPDKTLLDQNSIEEDLGIHDVKDGQAAIFGP
ncbi:unnamed protein product, partial [Effrenium voratum]